MTEAVRQLLDANPDRDCLAISAPISRELHAKLSRMLDGRAGKKANATLFLTTYGGDPDGAYRIGRCLRHHYKHVRLVIPSWCKSAGTLIAIAADELAIGDYGELGPLDIQIYKGSELQERSSGLDITEAIGAVKALTKNTFHEMLQETRGMGLATKLSAEFATQLAAAISQPLFTQIDPLRMGELQRLMRIAYEYGERLNKYTKSLKDGALSTLISGYPSHSFVIDRKEAGDLFKTVAKPTGEENIFAEAVWAFAGEQGNWPPMFIELEPANPDESNDDHAAEAPARDEPPANEGGEGDGVPEQRPGPGEEGVRVRADDQRSATLFRLPAAPAA